LGRIFSKFIAMANTVEVPTGNVDGVNALFTLSAVPLGSLVVTKNGLVQQPTADYSVGGNQLTFVTAPDVGSNIQVFYARALVTA
jgi:hypothetical protein